MAGSIRGRLLLVLGVAIAIASAAVAVAVYRFSMHEADELFDAQLARSSRILMQMIEPLLDMDSPPRTITPTVPNPVGHPYERKLVYQVWTEEGSLLLRSSNAPDYALGGHAEGYADLVVDDRQWRVFSLNDRDRGLWFVTGESTEIRRELSTEIALSALLPLAFGMLGLTLAVGLACTYGLAGIRRVSQAVARQSPGHLDPIDEQLAPMELQPLVAALNRLMLRVSSAMQFERRFTADAAHELRTPLAALRVHLENALGEEDPESRRASLIQTGRALERMIRLVDHLLLLSRLDPDAPELNRSGFDIAVMARETIADLQPLADARDVSVELDERGPAWLVGIPVAFESLVRNLVDNAIRYSPAGGQVRVEVSSGELRVEDEGPGIPDRIRDRVFERFVRGERDSDGSGLGLSIVRRVAALHGAEISLAAGRNGQVVRVRWPVPDLPDVLRPPPVRSASVET